MADTATLFILAAGITFVVMLGGIDLSIQAVASLSSVIVAITLSQIGYWAFPATLLVGFITGAFSGVVHVWLRIPSFIVTLATSGLVAAAALLLSQERSITIGETGRAYLSWITGRPFGIPSVILIGAIVAVCRDLVAALHSFRTLQHRDRRRRSRDLGLGRKSESAKGDCLFFVGGIGGPGRHLAHRPTEQRFSHPGKRTVAPGDRCGGRRRHFDHRGCRRDRENGHWSVDYFRRPGRHDVCRRRYFCQADRLRRWS